MDFSRRASFPLLLWLSLALASLRSPLVSQNARIALLVILSPPYHPVTQLMSRSSSVAMANDKPAKYKKMLRAPLMMKKRLGK